LGYSQSAAGRRIQVARCIARFPEIRALLASNVVNMSTVAQVSRVLDPSNRAVLLRRIRGRSQREVEAIVAEYEPRQARRDRVRSVVVRMPVAPLLSAAVAANTGVCRAAGDLDVAAPAPGRARCNRETETRGHVYSRNGSECKDGRRTPDIPATTIHSRNGSEYKDRQHIQDERSDRPPTPRPVPLAAHRVRFQFDADGAFRDKVEKVRALAWHRLPGNASLAQVFQLVMDDFIKRNDPIARKQRRDARRRARTTAIAGTR
jgi:hypothetical protein